jgi:hypothetical protein
MCAIKRVFVVFFAMLFAAGLSVAAEPKKPDGTVTIAETEFALILGGTVGGGKLSFKGKDYEFKIGGLPARTWALPR